VAERFSRIFLNNECLYAAGAPVSVAGSRADGSAMETIEGFTYQDLGAAKGAVFGTQTPIPIPDQDVVSILAQLEKVTFEDGSVWENKGEAFAPLLLSEQKELIDHFEEPENLRQYRIDNGSDAKYVPGLYGLLSQAGSRIGRLGGRGHSDRLLVLLRRRQRHPDDLQHVDRSRLFGRDLLSGLYVLTLLMRFSGDFYVHIFP